MPPTILILGAAGGTGRALIPLLLDHTAARLILAGRESGALGVVAGAAAARAPGRSETRVVDGTSPTAELEGALAGAQLVVVAAPLTRHVPAIVRAATAAGADTLDIQCSPEKTAALSALDAPIAAAGRTAITDGGFHPGLPAVLARAVADEFSTVRSVRIGSVIQEDWRALRPRPETAREFMEIIAGTQPAHFVDGRWLREPVTSSAALVRFDFGAPFGERRCYAMALEEMRLWSASRPGLVSAGFYVGGFNPVVDYVVLPLLIAGHHLAPARSAGPLARLLLAGLRGFSRPPYGTLLRLEAEGQRAGQPHRLVLSVFHRDSYALTAMCLAAAIRQWADGSARGPGVRLQALVVEPRRFLRDLERFGATVTEEATSSGAAAPASV